MNKKAIIQAVKFVLFSASAAIIQAGASALFLEVFKWEYYVSYLIALLLSVLWNFTFNRRFTFKSAANVPIAMAKVLGFYAVFTPLSTWLGDLAVDSGVNEYIVLAVTMICNLVLEFLFCKFVVYHNQEDTLENRK